MDCGCEQELGYKAKLSIYWPVFVPTLPLQSEALGKTNQTGDTSGQSEVSVKDGWSQSMQQCLAFKVLLRANERSHMRWSRHLAYLPTRCSRCDRLAGDIGYSGEITSPSSSWCLGVPQEDVTGKKEI